MRVKSIASVKHRKIRQLTKGYKHAARKRITVGKELKPYPSYEGEIRRFMWSPICANTRIAPINLPEHTQNYEGFCVVPVKYFTVGDNVLQDITKEQRK